MVSLKWLWQVASHQASSAIALLSNMAAQSSERNLLRRTLKCYQSPMINKSFSPITFFFLQVSYFKGGRKLPDIRAIYHGDKPLKLFKNLREVRLGIVASLPWKLLTLWVCHLVDSLCRGSWLQRNSSIIRHGDAPTFRASSLVLRVGCTAMTQLSNRNLHIKRAHSLWGKRRRTS